MNLNLIKRIAQNSKKCEKLLKPLSQDRLHRARSSMLVEWPKQMGVFPGPTARFYCQESGPPACKLPPLMDFPAVVWPSVFKSLKNLIFTTLIIKPYMDAEFSLADFVQGSKKAVEVSTTFLLRMVSTVSF